MKKFLLLFIAIGFMLSCDRSNELNCELDTPELEGSYWFFSFPHINSFTHYFDFLYEGLVVRLREDNRLDIFNHDQSVRDESRWVQVNDSVVEIMSYVHSRRFNYEFRLIRKNNKWFRGTVNFKRNLTESDFTIADGKRISGNAARNFERRTAPILTDIYHTQWELSMSIRADYGDMFYDILTEAFNSILNEFELSSPVLRVQFTSYYKIKLLDYRTEQDWKTDSLMVVNSPSGVNRNGSAVNGNWYRHKTPCTLMFNFGFGAFNSNRNARFWLNIADDNSVSGHGILSGSISSGGALVVNITGQKIHRATASKFD